ncbi:unnamed protein product [Linum trigynum]|uniref:Uncharacterized protein n=1 Tax=Linum trigynum TaxID=586398 RepID=A0AAV2DHI0_9ROSI
MIHRWRGEVLGVRSGRRRLGGPPIEMIVWRQVLSFNDRFKVFSQFRNRSTLQLTENDDGGGDRSAVGFSFREAQIYKVRPQNHKPKILAQKPESLRLFDTKISGSNRRMQLNPKKPISPFPTQRCTF